MSEPPTWIDSLVDEVSNALGRRPAQSMRAGATEAHAWHGGPDNAGARWHLSVTQQGPIVHVTASSEGARPRRYAEASAPAEGLRDRMAMASGVCILAGLLPLYPRPLGAVRRERTYATLSGSE